MSAESSKYHVLSTGAQPAAIGLLVRAAGLGLGQGPGLSISLEEGGGRRDSSRNVRTTIVARRG